MITKIAHIRLIINAGKKSVAKKIVEEIFSKISFDKKYLTQLTRYEDDHHFEISFSSKLSAKSFEQLEHKAFKLCTAINKGPWLFHKLPEKYDKNNFEFLAIFNHEAFIKNEPGYSNKLKWVLIEIFS